MDESWINNNSVAVSPLLRKIRLYKERKSRSTTKDNNSSSDGNDYKNNSSSSSSPTLVTNIGNRGSRSVVLRRKRSKTVSPMKFAQKKSPRLRRLAASLHLPHYRKNANITVPRDEIASQDWAASRSASLPCKFTYRSPSIVGSLAQQYVLEYCPSFDGFTRPFVDNSRNNCETILKYDDQLQQASNNNLASPDIKEERYICQSRVLSSSPQPVVSSSTVASPSSSTKDRRVVAATSQHRSRASSCDRSADMAASTAGGGVQDKMKQVLGRRLSAFSGKLLTNDRPGMPSGDVSSSTSLNVRSLSSSIMRLRNKVINNESGLGLNDLNSKRTGGYGGQGSVDQFCLKEGRVNLTSGYQTRERYIFLFNDLLLVAKENGLNSYTLKDKIKLCQLWVSNDAKYIDSIADYVKNVANSITIGWPTKNFVAEFNSLEERNSWFNLLDNRITEVVTKKYPPNKSAYASVQYKTRKTCITRKIAFTNGQHVDDLLQIALLKFNLNIEGNKSASSFQLYAQFGKENASIRLHGYERPLAILKAHIRDLLDMDDEVDADAFVFDESFEFGLTFLLKQKRPPKLAKTKRTGAGQLVIQLKNRVRHNRHGDALIESPTASQQSGKLFGIPLDSLAARCTQSKLPDDILSIMERIFNGGMYIEGIFRKSPNHRVFREIREKLDCGIKVDFNEVQPCVCASLLKEFLRLLPDSLLTSELLPEWMSTMSNEAISLESKVLTARSLIARMPEANCQLLRRLLCLFYHIKKNEWANHMNSHSLSICLAPSLIGSGITASTSQADSVDLHTRQAAEIIKFFIENVVELFGIDTLSIFGEAPDPPNSCKRDSSEESDSMGVNFRRPTGSLDSLIMDTSSPDGSRPQSAFRNVNSNPTSMNLSRDSGLSDLHASVEDVAEQRGFLERGAMPPNRSVSQSDASDVIVDHQPTTSANTFYATSEHHHVTKSVDNLSVGGDSVPLSTSGGGGGVVGSVATSKSATLDGRHGNRMFQGLMSRSWHVGVKNVANSESSDSLYESLESTCSFVDPTPVPPARKSRSSSVTKQNTLIRSPSGERLISIVINRTPGDVDGGNSRSLAAANKFRTVVNDDDISGSEDPIIATTALATTVARSSSSPSPVSFMDRYSAIRKPARHRKYLAPSPPQSKKTSLDWSLDSRSSSITQESVADSHDDSARSSMSQQSVISAPCYDDSLNVINHSASDMRSQWLSAKIASSLNEIRDQITQAALQQTAAGAMLLTAGATRFGSDLVNDSSTLTDTSSEDRTPRVSREGSRASRDCCERSEIRANLRNIAVTLSGNNNAGSSSMIKNNSNITAMDANKRMSQSVIEDHLYNARRTVSGIQQRQRPPSYHEACQQKHQQQTTTVANVVKRTSEKPLVINSASFHGAYQPKQQHQQQQQQQQQQSGTAENVKRKDITTKEKVPLINSTSFAFGSTCVGSKFDYSKPPLGRSPGVISRHPTTTAAAGIRTKDISWSVREKVDLFDKNNQACESNEHNINNNNYNSNNNVRISRSRAKMNTDSNRPLSSDQVKTVSCYGDAPLAAVRLSDSYANYPVVRPPPLTTRLSTLSTTKPGNRYSSPAAYRNTGGGQHRANYRSVSVHHPDRKPLVSTPVRSVDTESYV